MADQIKQTASQVAGQAREKVEETVSSQKDRAAGTIDRAAEAMRATGQTLQKKASLPGEYVESAAEKVEGLGRYMREHSLEDMLHDVERFARRDPAIFYGGAFTLGLIAARFLKSSSRGGARPMRTYEPEQEPWGVARGDGTEFAAGVSIPSVTRGV